jgi:hypothetical protein
MNFRRSTSIELVTIGMSNVRRKFFHPRSYRGHKVLASRTESFTIATSFGLRVISWQPRSLSAARRRWR